MGQQQQTSADSGKGNSRYAEKVKRRNQMYGPGCCAHSVKVPHPPKGYWWEDKTHMKALGLHQ